jgi:hypothetical protein
VLATAARSRALRSDLRSVIAGILLMRSSGLLDRLSQPVDGAPYKQRRLPSGRPPPVGALNAACTGDSAHCAAEAINRLLAIEGVFLGSLQYAVLGVVIQSFVGATSRLNWSSVSWFTLDP